MHLSQHTPVIVHFRIVNCVFIKFFSVKDVEKQGNNKTGIINRPGVIASPLARQFPSLRTISSSSLSIKNALWHLVKDPHSYLPRMWSEGTIDPKLFFMPKIRHSLVLSSVLFAFQEPEFNFKSYFTVLHHHSSWNFSFLVTGVIRSKMSMREMNRTFLGGCLPLWKGRSLISVSTGSKPDGVTWTTSSLSAFCKFSLPWLYETPACPFQHCLIIPLKWPVTWVQTEVEFSYMGLLSLQQWPTE